MIKNKQKTSNKTVLFIVSIAIFTDMLMYGLVVPFLPIYATDLGASQSFVGILFASYAIALFIATPISGALADRIGRKIMITIGLLGLGVTTIVFAMSTSLWLLVIARALQGVAASIPWSAGLAFVADVFPSEERGKAMGIAISGQSAGVLFGPLFGGWLFELGGYKLPFFVAGGISFLTALLRFFCLRSITETKSERFVSSFGILRQRQILIIAGIAAIGAAVFASIEPTLPIHITNNLHASPGMIGLLFVIPPLAYGIIAPIIGIVSTKIGHVKSVMLGIVLVAVVLPLNALPQSIGYQAVTLALLGVSLGIVLTPALPKLADISEQAGVTSQGIIFAVFNTAYSFGMIVGPLIASLLTASFGLTIAYAMLSILFIIYLIPLYKLSNTHSKEVNTHE
ncbi:MFS transporter [Bacillus sp. SCS-151]|uniref:MFS transporter n=1 Tax=Nanhaiella sioensis TaxID=3115293 RepID=UPI00397D9CE0